VTTRSEASERAASVLREIGGLLALQSASRFKSRAYERAADIVESVPDLRSLVAAKRLTSLPGIGTSIERVVEELVRKGRSTLLERLREQFPPGTAELAPFLSLARIRMLHEELGVKTLAELREACRTGRVRALRGFGEKSEQRLLARIESGTPPATRAVTLAEAATQAASLHRFLRRLPLVSTVEVVGDLRRRVETIDRLELIVATREGAGTVAAHARKMPGLPMIDLERPGRFRVRRPGALDAYVGVVSPADFAIACVQATGSSGHVAALTRVARRNGLVLGDRALRREGRKLRVQNEETLYRQLGLQPVPPELREDVGEIEAAARGEIPSDLLCAQDIQGLVHCHTEYSDGRNTIEEMARSAEELGYRYITITDHSASATYARGLDVDRLRRQADEIAQVQRRVAIRILHGTESDILQDGALDFPDKVLERLDVIIASIHQRHRMGSDAMTKRIVRAMRHPLFKIWGHALGRYVLSRPPFECQMDEVFDAIASSRAAIEVNGDPNRLDLAPAWIREAKKWGISFVVSTDAHSIGGLQNVCWGVDMARRGWLRKRDVLNTLSAAEFATVVRAR
jgi:DNA polymerase (family 10)